MHIVYINKFNCHLYVILLRCHLLYYQVYYFCVYFFVQVYMRSTSVTTISRFHGRRTLEIAFYPLGDYCIHIIQSTLALQTSPHFSRLSHRSTAKKTATRCHRYQLVIGSSSYSPPATKTIDPDGERRKKILDAHR